MLHGLFRELLLALLLVPVVTAAADETTAVPSGIRGPEVDFEQHVAPILLQRCLECHQEADPSGGLALSRAELLARGGDSGAVIVPGNPQDSLLFQRVQAGEMPPEQNGHSMALEDSEVQTLRSWIQQGADYPAERVLDLFERTLPGRAGRDWWSLQPLQDVTVPVMYPGQHPIDAFVQRRLQQAGLQPAARAEWSVLIRRLTVQLTGLPPQTLDAGVVPLQPATAAEQDLLLADLMERLLAMPAYGERWARHWLDVVRYADTSGYERDQEKPFSWKYRDWVIQAFNEGLPWDEFIVHQLAGDQIENPTQKSVTATGFLRLGTWNDEPNDPQDYTFDRLEDLVHTTSTAFLGLTVKCARCHDHKFDPIPHADYYRFAAAFWTGPVRPRGRALLGGPSAEELGYAEILGWTDTDPDPPPFFVLQAGDRQRPLQRVSPGSLSCLETHPGFSTGVAGEFSAASRLQLARWIASDANPLTARVAVNRIWQHHFGEGLVRSPDNFGFNGESPTHPELLDWLAGEFVSSGWNVRHIHRVILSSRTWQQSSLHSQEEQCDLVDSSNRLLWKMPRRRADAETLRDSLLAVSGELDFRMGGRGFFPEVPAEALEGLSRKGSAWTASPADQQLRRSIYIYSQRSLLPPMMTAFDFADTTLPCGRRDSTIVAPQALTLLNNDFVHQRAAALARQLTETVELQETEIIRAVWARVLNRVPEREELELAAAHLQSQQERFLSLPQLPAAESQVSEELLQFCRIVGSKAQPDEWRKAVPDDCVLLLEAGVGLDLDEQGGVLRWRDQSSHGQDATQQLADRRPQSETQNTAHPAAVRFAAAARQYLDLGTDLLSGQQFSIFAVTSDSGKPGHRELLSNWSGREGNSVTSLFLGLTAERQIRLSDAMSGLGAMSNLDRPFLFSASSGPLGAMIFQGHRGIHATAAALPERRLDTPWVIGQQGNFDAEYWDGTLSLLMVFSRQLNVEEQELLRGVLLQRYDLPADRESPVEPAELTPRGRAVASLCLVLMNSNEFLFID